MATLFFDGDKRRIYEVPDNSSFTTDINGYRIYVPNDLLTAEKDVLISTTQLWSRFVDYHNVNLWVTLALAKTGGAFRFVDENGDDVFAGFDLRLQNQWLVVPANYTHNFTIVGNAYKELSLGETFDVTIQDAVGISPRVEFADKSSTIKIATGSGLSTEESNMLAFLYKFAMADEIKDKQNNKYFKKEAGTETILLEKDYSESVNEESLKQP